MSGDTVKFKGCKHLIFDRSKIDDRLQLRHAETFGAPGVYWERPEPYPGAPTKVQFCALRGRLNSPTAGISVFDLCCRMYDPQDHEVQI